MKHKIQLKEVDQVQMYIVFVLNTLSKEKGLLEPIFLNSTKNR